MRYLYKIYAQYDHFYPQRIRERLRDDRWLTLAWKKYLDEVARHDEVWVVFTGRGFPNGVYVKGLVAQVDARNQEVILRVRRHSANAPLTDAPTSAALVEAVRTRGRQVFAWPRDRDYQERCSVADCAERRCLNCDVWNGIPQIEPPHYQPPSLLRGMTVVPAYWIIPRRCFLYRNRREPSPWIQWITEMFNSFKVGEKRYAFPLAAGVGEALRDRGLHDLDAIVPVPLSPEKQDAGELNRTGVLARELGALLEVPVVNALGLSAPISKRRMLAEGHTPRQFQNRYRELLEVDATIRRRQRILLLDDVITRGLTLSVIATKMLEMHDEAELILGAAGQMIVTEAVRDVNGPAW